MITGFHTQDNLYFRRLNTGDVMVTWYESPNGVGRVTILPATVWASVMASMSVRGEDYETWQEANVYHTGARK